MHNLISRISQCTEPFTIKLGSREFTYVVKHSSKSNWANIYYCDMFVGSINKTNGAFATRTAELALKSYTRKNHKPLFYTLLWMALEAVVKGVDIELAVHFGLTPEAKQRAYEAI